MKKLLGYSLIINLCQNLFFTETRSYGADWRVMRIPSILDQMSLKIHRIKILRQKNTETRERIIEIIEEEFLRIINDATVTFIQIERIPGTKPFLSTEEALGKYSEARAMLFSLIGNSQQEHLSGLAEESILEKISLIKTICEKPLEELGKADIAEMLRDIVMFSLDAFTELQNQKLELVNQ